MKGLSTYETYHTCAIVCTTRNEKKILFRNFPNGIYSIRKTLLVQYGNGTNYRTLTVAIREHAHKADNLLLSHKSLLDSIGKELGYKSMDDWYNSSREILQKHGGSSLLSEYNHSLIHLLKSVYPSNDWLEWKFSQVPLGFWEDQNNQKRYIEWLGDQLGLRSLEDWYKLTQDDIFHYGGKSLLVEYYRGSPFRMIEALMPQYEWLPWRFEQTPSGYWEDLNNQKKFADWVGNQLGYKCMEDWYQISTRLICKFGGRGLLNGYYHNSTYQLLQTVYPTYSWNPKRFKKSPKGTKHG